MHQGTSTIGRGAETASGARARRRCPGGTFGAEQGHRDGDEPRSTRTRTAPALRLDDVNGDGLDDLVQVALQRRRRLAQRRRSRLDASATSSRTRPASPSYLNRVRLVDMNGSGTRDILWGDGEQYHYMDLRVAAPVGAHARRERPREDDDIDYATSTSLMLAARGGHAVGSVTPMPLDVVTQMTDKTTSRRRAPRAYYVTSTRTATRSTTGASGNSAGSRRRATRSRRREQPELDEAVDVPARASAQDDENVATTRARREGLLDGQPARGAQGLAAHERDIRRQRRLPIHGAPHVRLRKLYTGARWARGAARVRVVE